MLYCLNPACPNPENPDNQKICQGCGEELAKSTKSYDFRLHYRVIRILGEGAFGRTYLSQDTDLMGEPRVIKKLIAQGQGASLQKAKELFKREAQQLYDLSHRQIPKLYAYFEQDQALFLVQEFIHGENLRREFRKQGRFSEQKIITLLQELLPVFQYIHNRGILHRDVKPDNIMRRRTDNKLILIDFGGAKQTGGPEASSNTMIYTPGYAGIEHMMGQPNKSSDLYSLAATCVRLLTGCFPKIDKQGNNLDDIYSVSTARWVWREYLKRQGIRVGDRLGQILDKMLQAFPQNRYQSAEEVLAALEELSNISNPVVVGQEKSIVIPDVATPSIEFDFTLKTFEFEIVNLVEQRSGFFNSNKIVKSVKETHQAEFFHIDLAEGITIEMVSLPGGVFSMGSSEFEEERQSNEGPEHHVLISSFFMSKYPITQAQWQHIMKTNQSYHKGANKPVETVSWYECVQFCQKLSDLVGREFRLPTEAEWEYAARAETITPFHCGETINTDLANYSGNYIYGKGNLGENRKQTTEVGIFPPNAFGLYDMHGNVWEWCLDTWHDDYYGAPEDGSAWDPGRESNDNRSRVLRGGSWLYGPGRCRSASREGASPEQGYRTYGFRLVCS